MQKLQGLTIRNFPMSHGKRDRDISGHIEDCYSCQGRGELLGKNFKDKGAICKICKGIGLLLVPDLPECEICHGTGKTWSWGRQPEIQIDCPNCDGYGYPLPPEYSKWG